MQVISSAYNKKLTYMHKLEFNTLLLLQKCVGARDRELSAKRDTIPVRPLQRACAPLFISNYLLEFDGVLPAKTEGFYPKPSNPSTTASGGPPTPPGRSPPGVSLKGQARTTPRFFNSYGGSFLAPLVQGSCQPSFYWLLT